MTLLYKGLALFFFRCLVSLLLSVCVTVVVAVALQREMELYSTVQHCTSLPCGADEGHTASRLLVIYVKYALF